MKKIFKIINGLLISVFLINLFIVDVKADDPETGAKKGDIRCPSGSGNKCTQNPDGSVSVTEKFNGVDIIKTVSKSTPLGVYNVKFEAIGAQNLRKKPAYVVLVLDASGSIGAKWARKENGVVTSAVSFSEILLENNRNVNLAYSIFNSQVYTSPNFQTVPFSDKKLLKDNKIGKGGSALNLSFDDILNPGKLDLCHKNGEKYVVIFGDGKYSSKDSFNKTYTNLTDACEIEFFAINFGNKDADQKKMYNGFVCGDLKNKKFNCGKQSSHYLRVLKGDYSKAFKEMAEKVGTVIENKNSYVNIRDFTGDYFTILNTMDNLIDFGVSGDRSYEFQIKIDSDAPNGWHSTNDGYKVLTIDDVDVNYTSSINPEVYWETEKMFFESCSETIEKSNSDPDSDTTLTYYSKKCEEGWNGVSGLKATLKVGDLEAYTKKFNVKSGVGFPITIELSTNVRCSYTFNYDKFKEDFQNTVTAISSVSAGSPEFYTKLRDLSNLYKQLNHYITVSNGGDINDLIKKFTDQDGTLKIKYSDNEEPREMKFINDFDNRDGDNKYDVGGITNKEDKKSHDLTSLKLNGIKNQYGLDGNTDIPDIPEMVVHDYIYTVNLSKKLKLEDTCLNMWGGDQEDCTDSLAEPNQLYGGNKYYTRFLNNKQAESLLGFISITFEDVGYSPTKLILEGDKKMDGNNYNCAFDISSFNPPKYRNIDLSNPFVGGTLFNSLTERTIGKNYLNENRSFIRIIDNNTWKNESDYIYVLSKENIAAIKSDTVTHDEKVENYMGKDCYFNANKNYICPFTRGILKNGAPDSIFFITSPKIRNGV